MLRISQKVGCVFFVLLLAFSAQARQEAKPSTPAIDKAARKAQSLFEQGEKYYRVGEYKKALSSYKEAYIIKPLPEFLFNMAQCYLALNDHKEALRSYQFYLRDVPDSPLRNQIEDIITELKEEIAKTDPDVSSSAPVTDKIETPPSNNTTSTNSTLPQDTVPKERNKVPWIRASIAGTLVLAGVGCLLGIREIRGDGVIENERERNLGIGLTIGAYTSFVASGGILASTLFFPKKAVVERPESTANHVPMLSPRAQIQLGPFHISR